MALSNFRQVKGQGQSAQLTQSNIEAQLTPLLTNALAGGKLVSFTSPATAGTNFAVQHGFGVVGALFALISPDAPGAVYTSPDQNPLPATQLLLRSDVASLKAQLYVFVPT